MQNKVYELYNFWDGKIAICSSYEKAFELGQKRLNELEKRLTEKEFQEVLDLGSCHIKEVQLDQFYC